MPAPLARTAVLTSALVLAAAACGGARGPRTTPPPPVDPPAAAATAAATPPTEAVTDAAAPVLPPRTPGGTITVTVGPQPAYVEQVDGAQLVNCDLRLDNGTGVDWMLTAIQVTVRDAAGAITWRKFLDGNGVSPSITTVPNRALAAGAQQLLLNPLHALPRDLVLARLDFELTFERRAGDAREALVAAATLAPVVYAPQARLRLPLDGRVLVWDAHDFLSHHRRWDYLFAPIRDFGFTSNAARYSYDLVPVDEHGAMFTGDRADDRNWIGWGRPVKATAAGTVVAVVDTMPDDHDFDMGKLKEDLLVMYGNRILVDHGGGEISLFAHLQQGSAKVKVGDAVRAGDVLAAIGASGSSLFPHLHYQLQNAADGHAEGVPSYFVDFERLRGAKAIPVASGTIDGGDFVRAAPARPPARRRSR